MFLRNLESFVDSFTNSYARNDYHEFAPAVQPVKLVYGLDVGVSFSCACLHFDGEVVFSGECLRKRKRVIPLNLPDVGSDVCVRNLYGAVAENWER